MYGNIVHCAAMNEAVNIMEFLFLQPNIVRTINESAMNNGKTEVISTGLIVQMEDCTVDIIEKMMVLNVDFGQVNHFKNSVLHYAVKYK